MNQNKCSSEVKEKLQFCVLEEKEEEEEEAEKEQQEGEVGRNSVIALRCRDSAVQEAKHSEGKWGAEGLEDALPWKLAALAAPCALRNTKRQSCKDRNWPAAFVHWTE